MLYRHYGAYERHKVVYGGYERHKVVYGGYERHKVVAVYKLLVHFMVEICSTDSIVKSVFITTQLQFNLGII